MQVEIWSDVVCPWCYIGKRRFESALRRFEHRDDVAVTYRSFELDPGAPPVRSESTTAHLAAKYGISEAEARSMNDRVTEIAAAEGLDYRLDEARPGNTFDAHRLLHLAAARGLQGAVKERFMAAYFSEGAPIGDHEALTRLATEAGLDAAEVAAVLSGDAHADDVRADQAQARTFGISGVPFFVVDRTYGVSGAQPAEVLLQVLDKAWAERAPLTVVESADSTACDDGSCAV